MAFINYQLSNTPQLCIAHLMLIICPQCEPEPIVQRSRHIPQGLLVCNFPQVSRLLLAPEGQGVVRLLKLLADEGLQLVVADGQADSQSAGRGVVHLHRHLVALENSKISRCAKLAHADILFFGGGGVRVRFCSQCCSHS